MTEHCVIFMCSDDDYFTCKERKCNDCPCEKCVYYRGCRSEHKQKLKEEKF